MQATTPIGEGYAQLLGLRERCERAMDLLEELETECLQLRSTNLKDIFWQHPTILRYGEALQNLYWRCRRDEIRVLLMQRIQCTQGEIQEFVESTGSSYAAYLQALEYKVTAHKLLPSNSRAR